MEGDENMEVGKQKYIRLQEALQGRDPCMEKGTPSDCIITSREERKQRECTHNRNCEMIVHHTHLSFFSSRYSLI